MDKTVWADGVKKVREKTAELQLAAFSLVFTLGKNWAGTALPSLFPDTLNSAGV